MRRSDLSLLCKAFGDRLTYVAQRPLCLHQMPTDFCCIYELMGDRSKAMACALYFDSERTVSFATQAEFLYAIAPQSRLTKLAESLTLIEYDFPRIFFRFSSCPPDMGETVS